MKKSQILATIAMVALLFKANGQIRVNSSGQVGINNNSPSYRLDVSGNFRISNGSNGLIYDFGTLSPTGCCSSLGDELNYWSALYAHTAFFYYTPSWPSDMRLKSEIRSIGSIVKNLMDINVVKYKMVPPPNAHPDIFSEKANEEHYGFLAQEVAEIFPELVTHDKDGTLGLKYVDFIPILVKACQEQQAEIAGLKARIEALENPEK